LALTKHIRTTVSRKKGTAVNLSKEQQGEKMGQVIAKCWADEGFKRRLLADPAATLKAQGVEVRAGLSIRALENTDKVFHLVIPARPTDLSKDLSDEELEEVVGGILLSCAKGEHFKEVTL
jgi:hypothetical protein